MTQPRSGYSTVAIALHWAIAAAILFQIGLGWRMGGLKGPSAFALFQLHKSVGITVLLLSLLRLAWRLTHRAPSHAHQPRWERLAAGATHVALYAIMIGLPFSGWIMVSTSRIEIPTLLYHVIPWPHVPGLAGLAAGPKAAVHDAGDVAHHALVLITLALLALHLGAVAKHQFIDRDGIFANMAPGARPRLAEPRLWGAAIALILAFALGRGWPAAETPAPQASASAAPAPEPSTSADTPEPTPEASASEAAAEKTPDAAQPIAWAVAKSGSKLDFTADWSGQPITGHFGAWDSDIVFSPDALPASHLKITVDIASAATGDAQRDASLPSADWFDAATHPHAVFQSDRITQTSPGHYKAVGTLDLRGVHKPLTLAFTVAIKGDTATASGQTVINRTLFGIGQGEWAATDQIAANVKVSFAITARRR
jgi:cytochrome b561/polyisoprenoid-binding protein YceI